MMAPPAIMPSRNGAWVRPSLLTSAAFDRPSVSIMMIEKIIVVAPTTAVPMSTGLAVALKVFPAPSLASRKCLATFHLGVKPNSAFTCSSMSGSSSMVDSS